MRGRHFFWDQKRRDAKAIWRQASSFGSKKAVGQGCTCNDGSCACVSCVAVALAPTIVLRSILDLRQRGFTVAGDDGRKRATNAKNKRHRAQRTFFFRVLPCGKFLVWVRVSTWVMKFQLPRSVFDGSRVETMAQGFPKLIAVRKIKSPFPAFIAMIGSQIPYQNAYQASSARDKL